MFLNYLPSEMVEVVGLTMIFSFLVGTILILLFTSDQANKNKKRLKSLRKFFSKFKEEYLLYIKNTIAKFKIRDLLIMFLNYLPSEMVEVVGLTMIFSFLVGTILILLFTSDQANTKNLYLKKAK